MCPTLCIVELTIGNAKHSIIGLKLFTKHIPLLQHEKAVPCFRHIEKLIFVRHSSEHETSNSDRKVNRNIYPDAGSRDMMNNVSSCHVSCHVYPHLAIYFSSPFGRYPTFHTLTSVGLK